MKDNTMLNTQYKTQIIKILDIIDTKKVSYLKKLHIEDLNDMLASHFVEDRSYIYNNIALLCNKNFNKTLEKIKQLKHTNQKLSFNNLI